ncbi:hypothetical protein BLA14095_03947 [Burkholderia lata]|nr:hypothetical protein BLA14095_03947 [Burkholderia lata]
MRPDRRRRYDASRTAPTDAVHVRKHHTLKRFSV